MRNNKKKSIKLEKRDLTVDEVLIQSSLIMIRTVADTKRGGAKVKFETEVNGDNYNIDVIIKKRKEKLYLRIIKFIKSLFGNKIVETPIMKKV